jgi:hypothetical protein
MMTKDKRRAKKKKLRTKRSFKAVGKRLQKEHPNLNSQKRKSSANRKRKALVTKEILKMLTKLPSNGHSTSGPAKRNMISEY